MTIIMSCAGLLIAGALIGVLCCLPYIHRLEDDLKRFDRRNR